MRKELEQLDEAWITTLRMDYADGDMSIILPNLRHILRQMLKFIDQASNRGVEEPNRTIDFSNHMTWPRVGSVWSHYNGNTYIVKDYTNVEIDRQDEYPTTIVYVNKADGKRYSRKLIDWERSMAPVHK